MRTTKLLATTAELPMIFDLAIAGRLQRDERSFQRRWCALADHLRLNSQV